MQPTVITATTTPDLATLMLIYNAARTATTGLSSRCPSVDHFIQLIAGEVISIATINRTIVGFVSVWSAENFIHHLYVDPTHHRTGVGSALIKHCRTTFGLPLTLKCPIANTAACLFYEKLGFHVQDCGTGDDGPYHWYCLEDTSTSCA